MLNSIELINHGSGFLIIGYESSTDVNDKAAWNKEKSRDFLGISEKQKRLLVSKVTRSSEADLEEIQQAGSITQRILDRLRGN